MPSKEMIKSYRAVIVDYNTYDKLVLKREENERTRKLMDSIEMMSSSVKSLRKYLMILKILKKNKTTYH